MDDLVTPEWLADRLGSPELVLLDATYASAVPDGDAPDEAAGFAAGHIPGARFMDLPGLSRRERTSMPAPQDFASAMAALGVDPARQVVLYDDSPYRSAARGWWLFRSLLPDQAVAILDGGLARWKAEGRPVETGTPPPAMPGHLSPTGAGSRQRTLADMRANLEGGAEQVLDARSAARFAGTEADPRGLPGGHISGARNLPYSALFDADGRWKRGDALRTAFADSGIDIDRPVVTTCGSGITAAVLAFGLHLLGRDAALYDGSWSEWAADPLTPKARA